VSMLNPQEVGSSERKFPQTFPK